MLHCHAETCMGAERTYVVLAWTFRTELVTFRDMPLCSTAKEPNGVCRKVCCTEDVPVLRRRRAVTVKLLGVNVSRPEMCLSGEYVACIRSRGVISVCVFGGE